MKFEDRKRHPEESDGVLKLRRHHFFGIRVEDGECGDHYCSGHTSLSVKCTCGWAKQVIGSDHAEIMKLTHRTAVVEYHLGLHFTEEEDGV